MGSAVVYLNHKEEHPMREHLKKLPGKSELQKRLSEKRLSEFNEREDYK